MTQIGWYLGKIVFYEQFVAASSVARNCKGGQPSICGTSSSSCGLQICRRDATRGRAWHIVKKHLIYVQSSDSDDEDQLQISSIFHWNQILPKQRRSSRNPLPPHRRPKFATLQLPSSPLQPPLPLLPLASLQLVRTAAAQSWPEQLDLPATWQHLKLPDGSMAMAVTARPWQEMPPALILVEKMQVGKAKALHGARWSEEEKVIEDLGRVRRPRSEERRVGKECRN